LKEEGLHFDQVSGAPLRLTPSVSEAKNGNDSPAVGFPEDGDKFVGDFIIFETGSSTVDSFCRFLCQ
jgi:hypothetical protein